MISIRKKAKTAAGARALKRKEPVEEEGAKTAIFCKATTSSQVVNELQKDLFSLKKPDAKMFGKKNEIHPFEDYKTFEFLGRFFFVFCLWVGGLRASALANLYQSISQSHLSILKYLAQKNENSFFCLASHSKKRPHNLVFARMFNYEMLGKIYKRLYMLRLD